MFIMEHDVDLSVGGQVFLLICSSSIRIELLSEISLPGLIRLSMNTIVTTVAIWFTDRAHILGRV